jgi:pyruvate dehydrogenase E2 component (dihydrolipoamide acetyltransferase)
MAVPVVMPKQGQSVESCILTSWHKKKGENVRKGEILFSYETDKASFEAEAESDGILLEVFYNEGDEIPVLTNIAVIGQPGEAIDDIMPNKRPSRSEKNGNLAHSQAETSASDTKPFSSSQTIASGDENTGISPRARKLAKEKGVNLAAIKGSGPDGRIIERDIQQYLLKHPRITPLAEKVSASEGLMSPESGTGLAGSITADDLISAPANYTDVPLSNIRRLTAKAMHYSLQHSAQLTHHMSADVSRMLGIRKKVKIMQEKGYQHNITLNDMICYAVIRALIKHPQLNAHFMDESIRYFSQIHLGIAVDTDRGLMVPSLRNASSFSLLELSDELKKLTMQCRSGNINPDLLIAENASFTVTNLGNYGVELFTPVINLPQVAILGVNTILYRPRLREDNVFEFAPFIGLSLTYDHRAIDGGPATKFLAEICKEIENFDDKLIL